jgi:hypothetical protein
MAVTGVVLVGFVIAHMRHGKPLLAVTNSITNNVLSGQLCGPEFCGIGQLAPLGE